MTNPLVEKQPESNDGFITQGSGDAGWASGIGIAESVNDVSSLNEGSSWVESGLAYGGLAMEGISLAVDPIGTLLSYGLSWLIEHVQPLKEALDWFAGDPDGVAAYGKTWENVSKAVEEAAQQYEDAVKADTASWTGAAGDAYRKTAAEKGEALAGAAKLAGTISSVVTIMGEVVSFVREFVRDLVADCISRLITYALEALLPPIASLAWVVPQAVAFISKTVTKIADIVSKLTRTISNVSPKLAKLAEVFGDIMKTLGDKGKAGAGAIGKVAEKLDVAERLAEKTWKKVDDTFGTDVVGKHNAKFGGPDAPSSGDGESSSGDSASGGGESGPRSSSGASGQGDSPASTVRSESTGEAGSPRSESTSDRSRTGETAGGRGEAGPDSRSNADSGGSTRTDSGSGSQDGSNSGGSTRSDTGSQSHDGSGSGGSNRTDSGSGAQDASNSGGSARSDSGSQSQADSSPSSGSQPHADSSGPQARPDSGTQSHADPGGATRADTGSSNADSGGSTSGAHTADVPRAPASTSAAAVDAPARPDAAAPQSAPAAPRPDQPSGNAPAGGAGAPASPSAPGGATPSPRGGRQGPGGWTGSSGHPRAVRDLPSNAPRTPRSPSHPAGPRPDAPTHAPRGGMPPRQAPHAPAPVRPVRSGAPHAPVRQGTPVQRPQSAPPRSPHLRTADSPRTPIPAQRAPETPNSLAEQPKIDESKVSTAESMAAETPPKDQWQAGHHMVDHTPRLNISPELREKLGPFRRDIEATGAGLSFTKPPVTNYFGRAEWAHKRPRCSVDPNRFTVEMHGGPNGVKFKHIDLDAKELAEIIRGSSGYKEGTPIRLVSCETGADVPDGSKNFAQQLSEELGVEVLAPNTNAWVDNHGNIYASESSAKFDKDESGTPKPRLDSPGEWTAFRPDGTKAVHSSPYPPGHQPEWVRHGVQAEGAQIRGIFGRRKDEGFSIDPVTGHNYSNAPPQGQYGPPPQNHGYHPQQQGFQQAPNQGFAQQPQHQGFPQQGYPQQGYQPQAYPHQGYPHQGYPQPGPAQPHPQPSAPPHYSNQPYQGYPQQPNSPQGYPQHSAPQNHPQQPSGGYPQQPPHVSQQGGYSPHPQHQPANPQPPQQGAYPPPQHPQGGYAPPQQPAHAQPRQSPPQQQGFPPQGGRPNAFPPSNPAQPWHGAQNTPASAQGGHGPGAQPQQPYGHAPNAAAPTSNPATPGAPGQPQTPWNNATSQRPSAPQQPAAPNPRPQPPGPPTAHQPVAPLGGGASRQLDGVGPAAPNGPAAPAATSSRPVLDDFTPTQSDTPSAAHAQADSSWKTDFEPAGDSKSPPVASSSHATPSTSKPVLDDFDPGSAHHETPNTPNKVEDDFAPKEAPQQQGPWSNAPRGSTPPDAQRPQDSIRSSSAGPNQDFQRPAAPGQHQSPAGGVGQPNSPHGASQPVPPAGSPHVQGGGSPGGAGAASFPSPPDATPPGRSFEDFLRDNGFEQGSLVPDAPNADAPVLGDRNPLDEFDFFGDKDFRATADDHSALRQLGKVLSDAEIQEIRGRRPDIEHITDEELSAMYLYTGMDHQYWNEALRNGDVEEVRKYETVIRNAISGMNKLPDWTSTPEVPKVHRGIYIDSWDMDNFLDRYSDGAEVTENAFTSSSKSDPFPGNVEFVIEAREGKDLEFLKPYGGMREVAWPPGNRFAVSSREFNEDTGKWTIRLTDLGR